MGKRGPKDFSWIRLPRIWTGPPRDPSRIDEMLELLGKLWKRHPDLRLAQLIVNLVNPSASCPEVFCREDDEMKAAMLKWMEESELIRGPSEQPDALKRKGLGKEYFQNLIKKYEKAMRKLR